MRMKYIKLISLTTSFFLLTACLATGQKEQLGTKLGAIGGAILGSQASGENKKLWVAAGGVLGAYIGNRIGRYLDDQDKQRMAQATQQAAASGSTRTWSNPDNKTSGQARVVKTQAKTETVKVPVLKAKVTKVPPLEIIGETYRAKKASNVRGGPGADYVKVGKLKINEAVNVVGKVKQHEWYLISQDGVGSGFVSTSLLEPAPNEVPASSGTVIAQGDVAEQQVSSSRVCRTVEQSVTLADGSTHSETIEACQGPNGWETKT